jgi:hypothetical protein
MLAYVFWHRPKGGVEPVAYEHAQRSFHAAIEAPSACFRLAKLPFASDGGYEDWYLVENWSDLGCLNEVAVDAIRRTDHDRAASMAADSWGAVYALVRGAAAIPTGAEWLDKPRDASSERFIASLPNTTVWRRQLVLGPAPEFCLSTLASATREAVWPPA